MSTQWFVKTKPLAEAAIAAVRDERVKIVPERFERSYFNWMENIRDWCISRQLWWGHRIPIWYGPDGHQFAARSESEALEQAIEFYGETAELEQDEDVLDTWFSSGLWPFSTLGWPQVKEGEKSREKREDAGDADSHSSNLTTDSSDFARYYPTTVLETGYDIIFFWVARMIMMGLYFTGEAPFRYVYLHGMVRAEDGRKMSKSLGNALDPLDLIGTYGNDALRFTLLTGSTPGNDMKLSVSRIEANRNFANKIWNAARFVLMNLETDGIALDEEKGRHNITYALPPLAAQTLADRWILSRLNAVQTHVTQLVENWQLGEAGRQLYGIPVERILRLVHRSRQTPALRRPTRSRKCYPSGARLHARTVIAAAASLHALCHRSDLEPPARRCRARRSPDDPKLAPFFRQP